MPWIAWIIRYLKVLNDLPDHPVHSINHTRVVWIRLAILTCINNTRICREVIAHFFQVKIQTFFVSGTNRPMHIIGRVVEKERLIFMLVHKAECQVQRFIKWTLVLIELKLIMRVSSRKIRETIRMNSCP